MDEFFDPNKAQDIVPVTLGELLETDRVIYFTEDKRGRLHRKGRKATYSKLVDTSSENLTFYVDEKTNLALPLRLKFFANQRHPEFNRYAPNQPVRALTCKGINIHQAMERLPSSGIEAPLGYRFQNTRINRRDQEPYFLPSESRWENDLQGKILEIIARDVFDPNKQIVSKRTTLVVYAT